MNNDLKPCPFCGSEFKLGQEPLDGSRESELYYIYHVYGPLGSDARKCRLEINGYFETKQEALDFWNNRHEPKDGVSVTSEPSAEVNND